MYRRVGIGSMSMAAALAASTGIASLFAVSPTNAIPRERRARPSNHIKWTRNSEKSYRKPNIAGRTDSSERLA